MVLGNIYEAIFLATSRKFFSIIKFHLRHINFSYASQLQKSEQNLSFSKKMQMQL